MDTEPNDDVFDFGEDLDERDRLKEEIKEVFNDYSGLCEVGFFVTEDQVENNDSFWSVHVRVRGCNQDHKNHIKEFFR